MTPEQEDKFRKAWIKQNQMDVIKKPRIAHMHNQELRKKGIFEIRDASAIGSNRRCLINIQFSYQHNVLVRPEKEVSART